MLDAQQRSQDGPAVMTPPAAVSAGPGAPPSPTSSSGSSAMLPPAKRRRAGSISGRLRSASDLCDEGVISAAQKGILKDLIIAGDTKLDNAFEQLEHGNPAELRALVDGGILDRRSSIDLMEHDVDLGFLSMSHMDPVGGFLIDDVPYMTPGTVPLTGAPGDARSRVHRSFDATGDAVDALGHGFPFGSPGAVGFTPAGYEWMDAWMRPRGMSVDDFAIPSVAEAFGPQPASYTASVSARPTVPGALLGHSDVAVSHGAAGGVGNNGSLGAAHGPPAVTKGGASKAGMCTRLRSGSSRRRGVAVTDEDASDDGDGSRSWHLERDDDDYDAPQPLVDVSQLRRPGYVGAYSPEARRRRIERFLAKRATRVWSKRVKYDVRKSFADSRLRVKGRFVKKDEEKLLRAWLRYM